MSHLMEYIKSLKLEFTKYTSSGSDKAPLDINNVTTVISVIVWMRQLEARVKDIGELCDTVLKDLNQYDKVAEELKEVLDEFREFHKDQFDNWCQEIQAGIKDNTLRYVNVKEGV